jgi:hypothetical protein
MTAARLRGYTPISANLRRYFAGFPADKNPAFRTRDISRPDSRLAHRQVAVAPGSSRSDAIWHSGTESSAGSRDMPTSPKAPQFPPRMFHVGGNFFARVSQFTPKFHLIKMRGVSEAWRSASKGKVGDRPIFLGFSSVYFFLCDGRGGRFCPLKRLQK